MRHSSNLSPSLAVATKPQTIHTAKVNAFNMATVSAAVLAMRFGRLKSRTLELCFNSSSQQVFCDGRILGHYGLAQHLELQRCYQNFVRPHSSLKFGSVTRTPAMQAGLAKKALTFREIFLFAIQPRAVVRSVRMSDWIAGRGTPRLAA